MVNGIRRTWLVLALLMMMLAAWPVSADDGGRSAIFSQDFTLEEGERLNQDLVVLGGRLHLERDSIVDGNVAVVGGDALIEGFVDGDVVVFGGSAELSAPAVIQGDLVVLGQVRRHPSAEVRGNTVEGIRAGTSLRYLPGMFDGRLGTEPRASMPGEKGEPPSRLARLLRTLGSIAVTLFLSALVVTLVPDHLYRVTRAMVKSSLLSLGIGVLTIMVAVILVPFLILICIGIPFAIVLLVSFLLGGLMGWVATGQIVGQKLFQMFSLKKQFALAEVLVGTVVIVLLAGVDGFGPLLSFLVTSWGVGAVVLTRFGGTPYPFWERPARHPPVSTSMPPAAQQSDGDLFAAHSPQRGDTRPLDEATLSGEGTDAPSS